MKDVRAVEWVLVFLVVFVALQGFFKTPEGINPEEELYRLKIHDLNQEKAQHLKTIKGLETKINNFENEILQNDSIVNSFTNDQLDSAFADYFKR
jgi:hypothetical protein